MRVALSLARRGLGSVWPNPAVGCVIVSRGRIVGRGWTQPGGRPHAETEALAQAGDQAAGGCAYVTLEPCNHHGRTPPCSEALLGAGIVRVVTALEDPDPRVSGGGHERLREGGITVVSDVLRRKAEDVNAGFLRRVRDGRPLVTLKVASTLDGKIASGTGESKWITGPEARARGHLLRANHDAIMIGIGTALADDPELTCRLGGLSDHSPIRIVVDSHLRLGLDSALVRTANATPTWVFTLPDAGNADAFRDKGVEVVTIAPDHTGRPDPVGIVRAVAAKGITRLLAEGGGSLAASLLGAGVIDRIAWFRASGIMGGDGLSAVGPFGVVAPDGMARFKAVECVAAGDDVMELYERQDSLDDG